MNKKLVALAVTGALALPVAAQAQTANVTLYGRVHMDVEVVNGRQVSGSNPNVFRVSSNSSRFGIRGTEALSGGLNAIFQIESGVPADVGGGTLAGRDTFVGLQGAWGTARMGLFHAPYDRINDIFGSVPTYQTGILGSAGIWAQGSTSKANGGFDDRLANSVRYDTPNMSGITASIQYGAGENAVHTGVLSAGIFYNNGPIELGLAQQHNEKFRGPTLDDDAYSVSGAYNFGFIRPAVVYEHLKYETPTGNLKRNFWGVSVTAPVGVGTVYALYGRANDGTGGAANGTRVGGLAKGSDSSASMYEISYTYPLSKRTVVYAGYVKIENDSNASYNFGVNNYPTAIGGKPGGFILGASHSF